MNQMRALVGRGLAFSAVVIAGAACNPVDAVKPYRELAAEVDRSAVSTWPMFPVAVEDVYRVIAAGGGREVELQRTGGGLWEPGRGAAPAAGSLMSAAAGHLIPMPAYRRLDLSGLPSPLSGGHPPSPGDPSADPGFGFGGSDVAFTVETRTAERFTIRFGGPNPTGGGYYVRRDGDPHVFVVAGQVFDEVRSLVAGTEIARPDDPRVEKALADSAKNEDPEEVTNPWLGQILERSGDSESP